MSKFKIKMKLQGLELDIEGSREDIPLIAQNLGQQLTGLLGPAAAIASGESPESEPQTPAPLPMVQEIKKRRKRQPSPATRGGVSDAVDKSELAVNFKHDSAKFGAPKQSWKTADKAVWLLYALSEQTAVKELGGAALVATFNKHFRQAGVVTVSNVNRDLGRLKVKRGGPPLVGEDTTQSPSAWYLSEEGTKYAQTLVADALGRTA